MAETSSGCMSPITFIFTILSTFVMTFMNFGLSSQSVLEPPIAATPTVEMVLTPVDNDITSEQFNEAYNAIEQRLTTLLNNGEITVYELEIGSGNEMIVRVNGEEQVESSLNSVLTTPGYLEFVDFSSVSADALSTYQDTIIMTTDSLSRASVDEGQDIFPTILTYNEIANAETFEDDFGNLAIQINLTDDGASILETFTDNNIGKGLAIVLDNRVLTIPVIQSRISSPIVLSGLFTEAEAKSLALQLNTRPLPIALEVTSISQIGQSEP